MTNALRFDSVSKKYNLNNDRQRSLQELIVGGFRRKKRVDQTLWVLKDISFAISRGESVALIGPNGAGKSTLLKLICSIIGPTSGRIEINGRVSSLLELGTGFHPDLTGRENIYLNGSMLGLSQKEIERKYETIVDFAELESYIDLPVKHYSSGMYLRLAFAVASHVEPDILLIDEAVAVGDHFFQQRCYKRLADLKAKGVTILLISHGMDILRTYCNRGIWLENGRIQADGEIERVVELYLGVQQQRQAQKMAKLPERISVEEFQSRMTAGYSAERWGNGQIEIIGVDLLDAAQQPKTTFRVGEPLIARIHYRAAAPVREPVFGTALYRADGLQLNGPNTKQSAYTLGVLAGEGYVDYFVESLNLLPGSYELSAAVYDTEGVQPFDHHHRLYRFQVLAGRTGEVIGAIYLPASWHHGSMAVTASTLEPVKVEPSRS